MIRSQIFRFRNQSIIFRFVSTTAILTILSSASLAQTLETGVDGLVVKNFSCYRDIYGNSILRGTLVNRTAKTVTGNLEVALIDQDGDFLRRESIPVSVGPQNGIPMRTELKQVSCEGQNRVAYRFR